MTFVNCLQYAKQFWSSEIKSCDLQNEILIKEEQNANALYPTYNNELGKTTEQRLEQYSNPYDDIVINPSGKVRFVKAVH